MSARGGNPPEFAQPLAVESKISRGETATRRFVDCFIALPFIFGLLDNVVGAFICRIVARFDCVGGALGFVVVDHAGL